MPTIILLLEIETDAHNKREREMSKYLMQIASYLYAKQGDALSNTTIVFPNRRAGLFFQKYLSSILDHAIFSPEIITISDLIRKITDLRAVDPTIAIIELYDVYKEITKSSETIDDFFFWGEMMLADFNDIDKYYIDAQKLFKNIDSLKEIDEGFDFLSEEQLQILSTFWSNILNTKGSSDKEKFLSLWKYLYPIYQTFNDRLIKKGIASEGQLYRQAALNLDKSFSDDERQYIFIGFNALNVCEKKIFDYLRINRNGLFFWDYDKYYIGKPYHEASTFLSENLKRYPMPDDFVVEFDNLQNIKEIEVIAVPGFMGQASFAGEWTKNIAPHRTDPFDSTAIVLCDEGLLIPIMNNISDSVESMNVTMGYPVKDSSVFSLVKSIADLDRNSRDKDGTLYFYYRTILNILNHPLLKPHLGESIAQIELNVRQKNQIYLSADGLGKEPLVQYIFNIPTEISQCETYIQHILLTLFDLSSEEDIINKECLYQCHLALSRLGESLKGQEISKKLFYQLLSRSFERLTIPFEGEPLSGLQIMGFLETRCLDFNNLLILSMNDNKLPGSVSGHSFIPYSLRHGFGLPSIEQKNAMYAYHFYRLIQRAEKVFMVYDSRNDSAGVGEISRYITQLKYEAPFSNIKFTQGKFSFSPLTSEPIRIEKDEEKMGQLIDFLTTREEPLSPSAISTYLFCTLKFYFKYIEKIHESDDVSEEIDQILFGKIAHKAIETIYGSMINKVVTSEWIQSILDNEIHIQKCLRDALSLEFFKGGNSDLIGQNVLIYDIILKYLKKILNYDKEKTAPFTVISLETKYETTVNIEKENKNIAIRIGGTIDRLDEVNGKIRVVDYKTGKADSTIRTIEDLFLPQKSNKTALQTLLYSMAVADTLKDPHKIIEPAVYGARSVFNNDFDPYFWMNKDRVNYNAQSDKFKEGLKKLLSDMINPDVPFKQTEEEINCSICPYKSLCNR